METAIRLSQQSKCVSKQVGAVIVKDGRIISTGYNGTLPGCKNCNEIFNYDDYDKNEHHHFANKNEIHAEQNALLMAAKHGISVNNCICYTSLQPCNTCLLLMLQSGIKEIVYFHEYERSCYDSEVIDYMKKNMILLRKYNDDKY